MKTLTKISSFISSLDEETKGQLAAGLVCVVGIGSFILSAMTNNFAWTGGFMIIGLISASVFAK